MADPRSEQEIFDDLAALCGASGYIHVLAYLSLRDNYVSYDGTMTGEAMAQSYAPGRHGTDRILDPIGVADQAAGRLRPADAV